VCNTQDITVSIASDATSVSITPSMIDDGSFDACGTVTDLSLSQTTFGCGELGIQTVTLTVTDQDNNVSTCTAFVTVEEEVPPTCNAGTVTLTIGADGTATLDPEDLDDGSTDDCGMIVEYVADQTVFTCDDIGSNTVMLTVIDEYGNESTCTGAVIIEETGAPMCVTQDITVNILDGNTSVSITPEDVDDGSADGCGTASLVTSTCEGTVVVEDNVAPICNTQDVTISLDENGALLINAFVVNDGSVDGCDGGPLQSLTVTPFSFNCEDIGENIVVMTAIDMNGNSSTCEATLTIEDTTAPECNVQDITVSLTSEG